ncbi:hypothetical protein [Beijerinckia sp. L45]|uniref:hypothetical protein n=1 Tax=Beijerinckia sp. L45 TaxID=1641855 RepID=UPI00131BFE34|nr:hypothetical protein [Beijerinckia sp. L45]
MVKSLFLTVLLCSASTMALAKDFKLGDDVAVTWITMPDSWEPEAFDDGVEGTSPDKETYVAAEIVKATAMKEAGEEAGKFFVKSKIKVDPASKKEKDTTMSGLPASDISWSATDADGPTHVSLTIVKITDDKMLLLTYWGSEAGEKSNGKELGAIAESIKPIK